MHIHLIKQDLVDATSYYRVVLTLFLQMQIHINYKYIIQSVNVISSLWSRLIIMLLFCGKVSVPLIDP